MAEYAKKKNDELAALCKERNLPHTDQIGATKVNSSTRFGLPCGLGSLGPRSQWMELGTNDQHIPRLYCMLRVV
jgi:hypothetical protein